MKFLAITLIVPAPDPLTGQRKPTADRFGEVVGDAVLAESPGFDGFGVGERQIIDKVHRYHEQLGHQILHLRADAGGLTEAQHSDSLELFQSDIAPALRRDIPDPPWPTTSAH